MKNKSYIGISFIILVFGIYAIPKIIDRIKNNNITVQDRLNASTGKGKEVKASLLIIGNVPKFSLINQDGKTITNDDFIGKVYVAEFFFSTCPSICPIMNENMKIIDSEFGRNSNFAIVSFTINPEYDTPEILKNHATQLGITNNNWHFLTGDKKYIYDIANKGFNIYAGESSNAGDAGFEHSGFFALVDKNGKIRSRMDKNGNPLIFYTGLNYNDKEGFEEDLQGKYKPGIFAIKEDIAILLEE